MNSSSINKLSDDFFSSPTEDSLFKILSTFVALLSNNDRYKKEIFLSLSDRGLNRLLALLRTNREDIRKEAFKVLVHLLKNSEILQNIFCEKFNFNPIGNVIVLNWLPDGLKDKIKITEQVLYEMKRTQNDNLKNERLFWIWPPNATYNKDNFPDPKKYLVGIYTPNQSIIPLEEKEFEEEFDVNDLVEQLEK